MGPFIAGDLVQTPLGKGVIRELRGNGRLLVDIKGRSVVVEAHAVTPLDVHGPAAKRRPAAAAEPPREAGKPPTPRRELDLHGLTVEEALDRCEQALNDALLADVGELRLIHGKSGGRIRDAVHRRLREISAVRAFRIDPRNAGVTIVQL